MLFFLPVQFGLRVLYSSMGLYFVEHVVCFSHTYTTILDA